MSFVFFIVFGEIVVGMLFGNPIFFTAPLAIALYYVGLTLLFALLFERIKQYWVVLAVGFMYGGIVEVLLFAIKDFVFAGIFYVFLFGAPYWVVYRGGSSIKKLSLSMGMFLGIVFLPFIIGVFGLVVVLLSSIVLIKLKNRGRD